MEPQPACALCGKETIHKCSACGNAYYCSKQHQKEDWKRHAQSCRAFKVQFLFGLSVIIGMLKFVQQLKQSNILTFINGLKLILNNIKSWQKVLHWVVIMWRRGISK